MDDGSNVIRGKFGRKPAALPESSSRATEDELSALLSRVLEVAGHESIYLEYVRPIRSYLASLQGHVSEDLVQERVKLLNGYTDDELIAAVKTSTRLDWKSKPAHYTALIRVIKTRENIV